jgi:hypothetical protein
MFRRDEDGQLASIVGATLSIPRGGCALLAAALIFTTVGSATAQELSVLVTAQARFDDVAERLGGVQALDATYTEARVADLTPALLAEHDVVIIWTHQALTDQASANLGNQLADYVDNGGAVVELVFAQFEPNPDVQGRWRSQSYAAVASSGRDGVFTAGALGEVAVDGHPILASVRAFSADRNRSGAEATVLPGADLVASYDDGQVLVATREDKPGRVAWLGFYPGDPTRLQGDWVRMIANAAGWAGQPVTANAGGPYEIEEGTATITLDASASGENAVRYLWDLDGDGEFGDAEGAVVEFDSSGLDGPGTYSVWVRVEDEEARVGDASARISVSNVAPVIDSAAPEQARLGAPYTYEPRIVDPAGDLDPLVLTLTEAPESATFEAGVISWTAQAGDLDQEFPFALLVDDGDGGQDEQSWIVTVQVADADGDGILDQDDNCPGLHNPQQEDLDGDTIGDKCDTDVDGDGLNRREEIENFTDERNPDTDGDGLDDGTEVHTTMTDPASKDTDDDGLDDGAEIQLGTDAGDPDTDDDGLLDGDEVIRGTDPFVADSDGDGVNDGDEVLAGSDPLDPDSTTGTGPGGPDGDLPPQSEDGCGCNSVVTTGWSSWLRRR